MRVRPELLVLVLIVAFLALMISLSHREDIDLRQADRSFVVRSSYRTFPEGYKVLYLTLDRLGYRVKRHIGDYLKLPRRGLLIVADPHTTKISESEKRRLADWLDSGNYALIAIEQHASQLLPVDDTPDRLPDVLTDILPDDGTLDDQQKIMAGKKVASARPVAPSFLSTRAPKLAVKTTRRFTAETPFEVEIDDRQAAAVMLYQDRSGAVVAFSPVGDGGIFWCTSPWSFSNEGLQQHPGNLDFVLALAGLQPEAPILFDEYHHGFGTKATVWTIAPMLTKLGIAELAIAFLLLLLTLGWRFGAVQLPMEERFSRSRAEYLTSMADLLLRVHATHVVIKRLRVRLGRTLGQRLGLAVNAPLEELVKANAAHPLVDHMLLLRTCRELELLEKVARPDEDSMLHLARSVERLVSLKGKK
ncbi:MAG: DUF4350 domain-containing protein [Armatimonadota bacterium]